MLAQNRLRQLTTRILESKRPCLLAVSEVDRGVLVCGTGIGMSVIANKVKGVRAALISDLYTAIQSRKHLDANILVLGGRVIGRDLAAGNYPGMA